MNENTMTSSETDRLRRERNRLSQQRHRQRVKEARAAAAAAEQQQQQHQHQHLQQPLPPPPTTNLWDSLTCSTDIEPFRSFGMMPGTTSMPPAVPMPGATTVTPTATHFAAYPETSTEFFDQDWNLIPMQDPPPTREPSTRHGSISHHSSKSTSKQHKRSATKSSSSSERSSISSTARTSPSPFGSVVEDSGLSKPRRRPHCRLIDGAVPAGRTPLHMLCESGSHSMVTKFMRSTGASPMAQDEFGMTPLHLAARRGNSEAVSALLDYGVVADPRDKQGWTPLHHAAWCGFDETITLLVERGASTEACISPTELFDPA